MLDNAFESLKKFDYGTNLNELNPIEDAVVAAHGKSEAGKDLETRLIGALQGDLTRDGREYVCRKLAAIGTAAAVPQLAGLVTNPESSHMARFALERISVPEAAQALRDALPKASGTVKVGILSSLGQRRDSDSVAAIGGLLKDSDPAVARAAALALGAIGSAEAVTVLQGALKSAGDASGRIIDSLLSCAESLLAGNKTTDATAIYTSFDQDSQPRLVRLAAARGLLACASKQA